MHVRRRLFVFIIYIGAPSLELRSRQQAAFVHAQAIVAHTAQWRNGKVNDPEIVSKTDGSNNSKHAAGIGRWATAATTAIATTAQYEYVMLAAVREVRVRVRVRTCTCLHTCASVCTR